LPALGAECLEILEALSYCTKTMSRLAYRLLHRLTQITNAIYGNIIENQLFSEDYGI
jgi:hypothetical protein